MRSRHIGKFVHVFKCETFWPNCSKFAVECDSKSKISQNAQNLGLFEKKMRFSRKKLDFFSKSLKLANFL